MLRSLVLAIVAAPALLLAQQPAAPAPGSTIQLDAVVAIVGTHPITRFDIQERLLQYEQQGMQMPTSEADLRALERQVIQDMVDEELILQKAKDMGVEVSDAELFPVLDRQMREIRSRFASEAEFRAELARAGLGTPEEYRRMLLDQMRRQQVLDRTVRKLREENKIIPVNVTAEEVQREFERIRPTLPPRPASVTFRQIVVAPQPTATAREVARVRAESLLATIRRGADFELIAKRESHDLSTRDLGGDLGWQRRGHYYPEIDRWLFGPFALSPGNLSPVVETPLGFHIIRLDRAQPAEVRARHILVRPGIDPADIELARQRADSAAELWRRGTPFDSLARRYHDYAGNEETSLLTPFPRDSLPPAYQEGFALRSPNGIVTFEIPGSLPDVPKFVVAQLLTATPAGERTLPELREMVRDRLAQAGAMRRYLDSLRRQTYVAILPDRSVFTQP